MCGDPRDRRFYVTFTATEFAVLRTAADRESMAPAAWAARAALAVAQEVLVPVSADRADVLRELVRARALMREKAAAVGALTPDHPRSGACGGRPGRRGDAPGDAGEAHPAVMLKKPDGSADPAVLPTQRDPGQAADPDCAICAITTADRRL
ncbi:hypothetical protein [Streptomyces sp. NPDC060322]|uniref:hypothetical protein n=1 Tax=Streptomyces sp. NPDC060322 TaxID=3347097 RepID=UPI0036526331